MSQIKIRRIKPQTVPLYNPDGEYMGDVNEYELNDVRIQIIEKNAFGYYVIFNNQKIRIDNFGNFEDYPEGFFNLIGDQLMNIAFSEKILV